MYLEGILSFLMCILCLSLFSMISSIILINWQMTLKNKTLVTSQPKPRLNCVLTGTQATVWVRRPWHRRGPSVSWPLSAVPLLGNLGVGRALCGASRVVTVALQGASVEVSVVMPGHTDLPCFDVEILPWF